MKAKLVFSLIVIIIAIAASLGATMAWFTDEAIAPENVFTAGSVLISAEETYVINAEKMNNVNPGDCFVKCFEIENEGSKSIELRLNDFAGQWEDLEGWGPVYIAPVPGSGWVMNFNEETNGFEFYYTGGPVASGESVTLCILVHFNGIEMTNLYQGKTFTLNGIFQAVQASNDAPGEVWGGSWNALFGMSDEAALISGTSAEYASYFYENGVFKFEPCLEENGNGNGNGNGGTNGEETAYAGNTSGTPQPWWYYLVYEGTETTQTIWAGQTNVVGSVTVSDPVNDEITITINLDSGWSLQNVSEAVKIQGYDSGWDQSWSNPGGFNTYKGNDLVISGVPVYDYYVIHLDVKED